MIIIALLYLHRNRRRISSWRHPCPQVAWVDTLFPLCERLLRHTFCPFSCCCPSVPGYTKLHPGADLVVAGQLVAVVGLLKGQLVVGHVVGQFPYRVGFANW